MGVFTYARAKEFREPQAARQEDVSLSKLTEGVNATMKPLLYYPISDVTGPKSAWRVPVLGSQKKYTLVRRKRRML